MEKEKDLRTLPAFFLKPEENDLPYETPEAQLKDWLRLVDLLCTALLLLEKREGEAAFHRLARPCAPDEIFIALEALTPLNPLPSFEETLRRLYIRSELTLEQHLLFPISRLMRMLTPFEVFSAVLAAAPDLNRKYEGIFRALSGGTDTKRPTLGLAADLFSLIIPVDSEELSALSHVESESGRLLFMPFSSGLEHSLLLRPLALSPLAFSFLQGETFSSEILPGFHTYYPPKEQPMPVRHNEKNQLLKILKERLSETSDDGLFILYLSGPPGCGRRHTLLSACFELDIGVLSCDCEYLLSLPVKELERQADLLCAAGAFYDLLIHFSSFNITRENAESARILLKFLNRSLPLIVCSGSDALSFSLPEPCAAIQLSFPSTSVADQRRLWRHFLLGHTLSNEGDLELLVTSMDLTAGTIKDVIKLALAECAKDGAAALSFAHLNRAVREKNRVSLSTYATLLETGYVWDDLILNEESLRVLRKVCARARLSRLVGDEWGFHKKLPYGRGLSVLLYGPPGTGKTMAASVLANDIGRDMYRVDLSQMVSKYIGETEKNLGAVFDAAKNVNAILFFDEADALFAKRTEVKDSKDKYANVETSYLLQKIEEHNGLSILATNNALNLDIAFKRRIHYFINIEMPDEEARLKIWRSVFPPAAPLAKSVDLSFFARKFELSGSEIKSVALEAAYMAAAVGGEIDRPLLLSALQDEYKKNGRILLEQDIV